MNRYAPHVYVLPEDDANRQLANGFVLDPVLDGRRIQILEEAGGWASVLERFKAEHVSLMELHPNRHMVLLIDFDGRNDRMDAVRDAIPDHLKARVFVLGVWSEPEKLRNQMGNTFETIGQKLAEDCRHDTSNTWSHELLTHNALELGRLRQIVQPFLFKSP